MSSDEESYSQKTHVAGEAYPAPGRRRKDARTEQAGSGGCGPRRGKLWVKTKGRRSTTIRWVVAFSKRRNPVQKRRGLPVGASWPYSSGGRGIFIYLQERQGGRGGPFKKSGENTAIEKVPDTTPLSDEDEKATSAHKHNRAEGKEGEKKLKMQPGVDPHDPVAEAHSLVPGRH